MSQKLPFKSANPPPNWTGTISQLIDLLRQNGYIEIPDTLLQGTIGSAVPPDNSGPWLKDGNEWWVWDATRAAYVPVGSDVEIGKVSLFAFTAIDLTRYVPCDGSAIPRVQPYDILYSKLGTIFGTGDGSTSFNVPDLRGRVPMGVGGGSIKNTGGQADTALTPRHLGDQAGAEIYKLLAADLPIVVAPAGNQGADGTHGTVIPVQANVLQTSIPTVTPSLALQYAIRYA